MIYVNVRTLQTACSFQSWSIGERIAGRGRFCSLRRAALTADANNTDARKMMKLMLAGDAAVNAFDNGSSTSVDTCLFDPVASETEPVSAVTDASRFVPCKP